MPDGPAFKPLGEMTEAELDAVMDFQIHTIYDRLEQFTRGNPKVRRALADRAIDGERLPSVASKNADKRMNETARRRGLERPRLRPGAARHPGQGGWSFAGEPGLATLVRQVDV